MQSLFDRAPRLSRALQAAAGQLTSPAVLSVGIVGVGSVLGYASQILVSRMIGPEEFGVFSYIVGLLLIGRTIASLGLDFAALRYVSIYFSSDRWSHVNGFLRLSRRTMLAVASLGAAMCAGLIVLLENLLPPHLVGAFLVGCVLLVPTTLLSLEIALLQALRLVYAPRIPFYIVRPLLFVGSLLAAVYVLGYPGTAVVALYANLVATVVVLLVSYRLMQASVPPGHPATAPAAERKQWWDYSKVNLGQNICYLVLSQQADVVVVGSLVGTTDAGYYAAASLIASIILIGVGACNQYFAPILAEHEVSRENIRLPGLIARIQLLNGALCLPLIAGVVLLGPHLLGLFGPSFVAAYPVIIVLALGCLVSGLWSSLWGDLMTMTGLHKEATAIVIAVSAMNLLLSVYLTPRYGMTGAAWATTAAVLARGVLVAIVVHDKFGFWPWTVWRKAAAA